MAKLSSSNGLEKLPKLRFPEFKEPWKQVKLSDFTERIVRKNKNNETDLPLTISSKDGLVDQISFFNKTVASKDISNYYLLRNGEFAYNKSYSVGYDFGSIKRLERYPMGALSTLYICFTLTKHNGDYIKTYFDSLKWYKEIYIISAEGARNHGLLNVPTDEFFDTYHYITDNPDEQQKIAAFMNLIDKRIQKQQQLLENIKKYKRGSLSALFPKKGEITPQYRFADFTKPWEQRKLNEVVNVYDGVHQTPDYKESGVMFLSVENISTLKSEKYISEEAFQRDYKVYPQKGDILMTRIGDVGTPNVVETTEKVAFYVSLALLKPTKINSYFLCNSIQSPLFQKGLKDRTLVTAIPQKINKDEIGKINIILPTSSQEQQLIGEHFRSLDRLITLHQHKYDTLLSLKNALLQQMFI